LLLFSLKKQIKESIFDESEKIINGSLKKIAEGKIDILIFFIL